MNILSQLVIQIRMDNRDNLGIIFVIAQNKKQTYLVTTHLNCLVETVLMRGHKVCFR